MADNSVLLKRADAAVLSRDYALAARLYSTLLKETPDDKDLLVRLGNVYIKSGEDEKALPVFQKLQEANPDDADLLLTLGGIYRRVKQYEESVDVLNKAIAAGGKRETAYYNLGFTYKFMGKYEDAIDCFETVVTLNTSDVLAYNHLGTIYELKGDHEAAITAYQKGLKVDSNHPILHLNLAKTFVASNNISAALREYDAALRYKPGWDEAYIDYTSLLLKLGRLKEAENLAEQGISLNGNNARLQAILGDIYMAESNYESAEEKYSTSINLEPDHTSTLKGLAKSLEAQGKSNEAIDTIQKAREISPDDDKLIKTSASINLSAQKLAAASKDIKELFDKDKDDVETLDLAGQYYICTDDEERAKKVYKKIEASDPEYKSHLSNASQRYKQKGNLQQAENYITKYLDKKPNDAQGLVSLAQIEEKLGKTEQALANYTKALANDKTNHLAKASSERLADFVSERQAAIQEQQEREAEEEAMSNLPSEFNMGEEEGIPKEEVEDEKVDFNEDDFDFDTFGHSELIDDDAEKELDFHSLADDQEQAEEEEDTPMSQDLLEDEPESEMPEPPKFEAPEPKMEAPEPQPQPSPAPAPAPAAPQFDANDLAEKMARMAEKAMDAAQMATNARQDDEARRLAEENARLRAEQQEAARRAAEETARRLAEQQEAARKAADETAKRLAEQQAAIEEAAKKLEEQQEAAKRLAEAEAAKKLAEEQAALEEARRKLEEEQEAARKAAEEEEARRLAEQEELEEERRRLGEEQEAARKAAEEEEARRLAEQAEAAKKLAEEQAALEEARRKLAKEQEAVKKSAETNALEAAVKKMGSLIPAIENILKKDRKGQDFTSEIKLFKTLRALSESLPDEDRKKFLQSRMRVTLDYLISALEGDPGLLKTSVALRKSGVLKDVVPEDAVETDYSIEELTKIVIGDMKALSENLEEKDLSIALNTLADAALGE